MKKTTREILLLVSGICVILWWYIVATISLPQSETYVIPLPAHYVEISGKKNENDTVWERDKEQLDNAILSQNAIFAIFIQSKSSMRHNGIHIDYWWAGENIGGLNRYHGQKKIYVKNKTIPLFFAWAHVRQNKTITFEPLRDFFTPVVLSLVWIYFFIKYLLQYHLSKKVTIKI